jgi:hypothetical protein
MVSLLLEQGAAVNMRSSDGFTPLMFAALGGHAQIIARLAHGLGFEMEATRSGQTALSMAIEGKKFEACKGLILLGAKLQSWSKTRLEEDATTQPPPVSPLSLAISTGFVELIVWLMETGRLDSEVRVRDSGTSCLNTAIAYGATSVVEVMVRRLLNMGTGLLTLPDDYDQALYEPMTLPCDSILEDGWQIADHFGRFAAIEKLLCYGFLPSELNLGLHELIGKFRNAKSLDLVLHANLLPSSSRAAANGLKSQALVPQIRKVLGTMAERACLANEFQLGQAYLAWLEQGLSAVFFESMISQRSALILSIARLGRTPSCFTATQLPFATAAQQLEVLIECLSDACGSLHRRYSDLGLTAGAELAMNRMLELQGGLILNVIAQFRLHFAQQRASLPSRIVGNLVAGSGTINGPVLYQDLTHVLGLYDPVARATMRLVQEALARLVSTVPAASSLASLALQNAVRPSSISLNSQHLRQAMAAVLEGWDKIPEIVEILREANTTEELDILADLLFQQWRLVCQAFDVEKERWQLYGPHQPHL